MLSNFNRGRLGRKRTSAGTSLHVDEVYDLRGLNMVTPDQVMPAGESPYLLNCRMYARQEGESRVAIRTRKGSRRLSTPIGEALNVQNTASSTGDATFTSALWIAEPFTPSSSGALTKLELEIKRTVAGGGHVIVEILADDGGNPGEVIAQGSILAGTITTSYQYLPAYFIDAPALTSGTQYWHRARVANGGTATYAINQTAASGGRSTPTPGVVYTSLGYTWRYKTYLATAGDILGFTRRYPQNKANRTLFAFGTDVYSVTNAGASTSISSAIHASAEKVRFAHVDDKTMWVDGFSTAKWWDGTTVSAIANVAGTPTHVIIHQQRAFFVPADDPTRVNFSDLNDFESYPSVNFFYVPSPKSPDHIAGWRVFQDNLVILTHETKHILYGSDLSSFTRKEAIGTKGAVSDEAIAVDRNYIYFMGDDRHIYRFNGVEDELLSEKVEPELQAINDTSKVRLHLYRNQLRVYYSKGTDTQANDMLLLELSRRDSNKYLQWFHDSGRAVGGSLELTQDNNELIEFSSKVGAIYSGETDESDLGKIISFRYWTNYKAYGSGSAKDRVKRFRPYVRPTDSSYTLMVGKDIDFANSPQMTEFPVDTGGATWGSFQWGDGTIWGDGDQLVDNKVPMSGRGKHTQYRFEADELECPVELYGYMSLIKTGRIR
ncbi:phage stabilization protein [Caudoviricetes sp.]|nr:phage stabilization protein [Caudoviricetes sp.]